MKDRQKEIQHRRYEIQEELKLLKKELIRLREEERQIQGENNIKRKVYKPNGRNDRRNNGGNY